MDLPNYSNQDIFGTESIKSISVRKTEFQSSAQHKKSSKQLLM